MIRRLSIIALILILPLSLLAQGEGVGYAPKRGDFQATVFFGSSTYFSGNESGSFAYLLPTDVQPDGNVDDMGLNGEEFKYFLNLGTPQSNKSSNMIGVGFAYFITDAIEVNAMFGMNINIMPKKDFIEGSADIPEFPIPNYKYISAETNHLLYSQIGVNRRFVTKNERISPYLGLFGGFQMARIESIYPVTGEELNGDPIELYRGHYRAGQMLGISGGITAGIDYALLPGFIVGIEVAPVAYQYSILDIHPSGLAPFQADNHSIKVLSQPKLKLGFRF